MKKLVLNLIERTINKLYGESHRHFRVSVIETPRHFIAILHVAVLFDKYGTLLRVIPLSSVEENNSVEVYDFIITGIERPLSINVRFDGQENTFQVTVILMDKFSVTLRIISHSNRKRVGEVFSMSHLDFISIVANAKKKKVS
jgi:hypothetical protein